MISVMNDFDIDRNPSSASDLSSFGMESPKEENKPDRIDLEIPPALDPPLESRDLEESRVRVSPTRVRVAEEDRLDMSGFLIGDMVWGKVKSHPWWPGHIFNEAFASPAVRRSKKAGHALVAFFGDSSYGWFDPAEMIPYESNFGEKSKQTTQKSFVKAVEESIDETGRRAALGLSCRCRNPFNFRPMKVPNYFEVDVAGYERNGIYSKRQINRERNSFRPKDALGFLQQLALTPRDKKVYDVEWYRRLAVWLAVRRYSETYAQAFGQQPVRPVREENGAALQAESFAPRGVPLSGLEVFADSLDDGDKKRKRKSAAVVAPSKHPGSAERDRDKPLKRKKKKKKRREEGDNFVLKRRDDYRH
ncbi:uncharacterized protein A4U43_C02F20920 [Asparagus officinalis]|uniref:PWWP domain-containing protein n=1 Tax=Asparagus officinalis TaxID=4686 RepID=A0A5P1FPS0_ASPOF|nr:uncharacterized protein LOC109831405 [Asparagus officinalis]ONK78640.1 uncharacterized protein A4U43_C02F20920 [Asparagus officinalis]